MRASAAIIALVLFIGVPVSMTAWSLLRAPHEAKTAPAAPRASRSASPTLPITSHSERPFATPRRSASISGEPHSAEPVATSIRWASDATQHKADQMDQRILAASARRDVEALRRLAQQAHDEGDWRYEILSLRHAVRLAPEDPESRFSLGASLMRIGAFADAVEHLRKSTGDAEFAPRAWHNLGVALTALGRLHEASEAWDETLKRQPGNFEALARRGETLLDLHEWSGAEADFTAALRIDPDCEDCRMNLVLALIRLGRVDDAKAELEKALARNPRNVPALNRLARMAEQEQRRDLVIDYCQRSLSVQPNQPEIRAMLEIAQTAH